MNILDIVKSWVKTANPTEDQLELALARKVICDQCPSKVQSIIPEVYNCEECGCPLMYQDTPLGKLFTEGSCPKKLW